MSVPELGEGAVHVWWLPAGPPQTPLTPDEVERMQRLRQESDRRRFASRRAGLREVLGAYLGIEPANVRIDRTCAACGHRLHGRPTVAAVHDLSFSTSSRGPVALVAVARSAMSIGADVERADAHADAVHQVALTDAERAAADPDDTESILRLWTRKEAVLKGLGLGLAGPAPGTLDVLGPAVDGWRITDLAAPSGTVAAIATAEPVHSVRFAAWRAPALTPDLSKPGRIRSGQVG